MQPEQLEKITGYFILEAKEHLELIGESLQDFQSTVSDPDRLQDIYRGAHSIKGGAAMLGIESIRRVAHRLEDFFKALKSEPVAADTQLQAELQRVYQVLDEFVTQLETTRRVAESTAAPRLAELEPLFVKIEERIDALQTQVMPTDAPNHPALHEEIASLLQNLNQLAAASDSPEQRLRVQACCHDGVALGQEWGISGWSALLNSAAAAIAIPSHDYARTLQLIARDVAAAKAALTVSPNAAIAPSAELQALVPAHASPAAVSDLAALDDIFGEHDDSTAVPNHPMDRELSDLFAAADLGAMGDADDLPDSLDDLLGNSEELWDTVDTPVASSNDDLSTLFNQAAASAAAEPELAATGDSNYDLNQLFEAGLPDEAELELSASVAAESSEASVTAPAASSDQDDAFADFFGSEPAATSTAPTGGLDPSLNRDLDSLFAAVNEETTDPLLAEADAEPAVADTASVLESEPDEFGDLLAISAKAAEAESDRFSLAEFESLPMPAALEDLDLALEPTAAASRAPATDTSQTAASLAASSAETTARLDDDLAALLEGADADLAPADAMAPAASDLTELDDLFSEPVAVAPASAQTSDDLNALDDLFAAVNRAAEDASAPAAAIPDVAPVEQPASPPPAAPAIAAQAAGDTWGEATDDLFYYDRFEELSAFLEAAPGLSAGELTVATNLVELTALLDALPAESAAVAPAPATAPTADDGFGDLEELLNETRRQAGEIAATTEAAPVRTPRSRTTRAKVEQTLKVPVRQMDNLSNLVGELVVNRNSLEGDEERLRQFLDSLMHQVQNLSDVGGRMQDLYERSLLEDALLRSRREYRSQQAAGGRGGPVSATAASSVIPPTEGGDSDYDSLEMDSFTKFHELAQETIEMIVRVRESASDIQFLVDDIDQVARTLRQVTSQLQEGLTKSRMVPFERTANRLPLAVRRIAPQLGKQASLQVEGQETLIDKMILEHLSDPLTHLVNNALTHGIEPPEIRTALGKPQAGQIVVSALQQGNQTVIAVSDDGGGIDSDRIKQKAVQKGILAAADAQRLTDIDVYDLLFHPGFSTRDVADNFAGRGVGLDVVRTSINEIRGAVSIDSKLGRGTTFTIRLPLTLSICKALCCISENAPIAFPLDGVEDMLDVPQHKITRNAEGHPCAPWRDRLLPYSPLSELLSYNRRLGRGSLYGGKRDDNMLSVVILRSASSQIAVGVDQVLGEQEIVIKQLSGPIPKPAGIAGATVQGDGRIMAIADVIELIEISAGRMRKDMTSAIWQKPPALQEPAPSDVKTEPMVLIVDDSITVRELLSITFSKAGYRVEQARDGQDAWDKLHSGLPCDIVFCDIEMPRVDGLELLSRLQKDEELRQLPVAMLTSRGAERHRRVAAELGASGYFTKPYLEEVLLDAAQRMIGGEVLLEGSTRPPRPQPRPQPAVAPAPAMLTQPEDDAPTLVQAPAAEPERQPGVLIIDDSVTVRSLLSMSFEKAGYEVEQARDGKDAWDKLSSGLEPDLVLCDIEMPRLDGLELLAQIQADADLQRIPVAMLTSRGAKKHRQLAAERGASAYFTKPYVEQDLLAAAERVRAGEILLKDSARSPGITTHVQPQAAPPAASELEIDPHQTVVQAGPGNHSAAALPEQPKVMIIDDSVTVRSLLSMTFENAGYEVEQARDGQDALNKLQGGLNPHLVFCDIEMPRMDGLKLLSHLQDDPMLSQIPVAMLTSRGAKKHRQIAAERGARGYFTKPYVEEVLLDAAQRLVAGEMLLEIED